MRSPAIVRHREFLPSGEAAMAASPASPPGGNSRRVANPTVLSSPVRPSHRDNDATKSRGPSCLADRLRISLRYADARILPGHRRHRTLADAVTIRHESRGTAPHRINRPVESSEFIRSWPGSHPPETGNSGRPRHSACAAFRSRGEVPARRTSSQPSGTTFRSSTILLRQSFSDIDGVDSLM